MAFRKPLKQDTVEVGLETMNKDVFGSVLFLVEVVNLELFLVF